MPSRSYITHGQSRAVLSCSRWTELKFRDSLRLSPLSSEWITLWLLTFLKCQCKFNDWRCCFLFWVAFSLTPRFIITTILVSNTMSSSISISNAVPPVTATGMETVVAIALGALAAVFLGALLVLLVICRRQRCYYVSLIWLNHILGMLNCFGEKYNNFIHF